MTLYTLTDKRGFALFKGLPSRIKTVANKTVPFFFQSGIPVSSTSALYYVNTRLENGKPLFVKTTNGESWTTVNIDCADVALGDKTLKVQLVGTKFYLLAESGDLFIYDESDGSMYRAYTGVSSFAVDSTEKIFTVQGTDLFAGATPVLVDNTITGTLSVFYANGEIAFVEQKASDTNVYPKSGSDAPSVAGKITVSNGLTGRAHLTFVDTVWVLQGVHSTSSKVTLYKTENANLSGTLTKVELIHPTDDTITNEVIVQQWAASSTATPVYVLASETSIYSIGTLSTDATSPSTLTLTTTVTDTTERVFQVSDQTVSVLITQESGNTQALDIRTINLTTGEVVLHKTHLLGKDTELVTIGYANNYYFLQAKHNGSDIVYVGETLATIRDQAAISPYPTGFNASAFSIDYVDGEYVWKSTGDDVLVSTMTQTEGLSNGMTATNFSFTWSKKNFFPADGTTYKVFLLNGAEVAVERVPGSVVDTLNIYALTNKVLPASASYTHTIGKEDHYTISYANGTYVLVIKKFNDDVFLYTGSTLATITADPVSYSFYPDGSKPDVQPIIYDADAEKYIWGTTKGVWMTTAIDGTSIEFTQSNQVLLDDDYIPFYVNDANIRYKHLFVRRSGNSINIYKLNNANLLELASSVGINGSTEFSIDYVESNYIVRWISEGTASMVVTNAPNYLGSSIPQTLPGITSIGPIYYLSNKFHFSVNLGLKMSDNLLSPISIANESTFVLGTHYLQTVNGSWIAVETATGSTPGTKNFTFWLMVDGRPSPTPYTSVQDVATDKMYTSNSYTYSYIYYLDGGDLKVASVQNNGPEAVDVTQVGTVHYPVGVTASIVPPLSVNGQFFQYLTDRIVYTESFPASGNELTFNTLIVLDIDTIRFGQVNENILYLQRTHFTDKEVVDSFSEYFYDFAKSPTYEFANYTEYRLSGPSGSRYDEHGYDVHQHLLKVFLEDKSVNYTSVVRQYAQTASLLEPIAANWGEIQVQLIVNPPDNQMYLVQYVADRLTISSADTPTLYAIVNRLRDDKGLSTTATEYVGLKSIDILDFFQYISTDTENIALLALDELRNEFQRVVREYAENDATNPNGGHSINADADYEPMLFRFDQAVYEKRLEFMTYLMSDVAVQTTNGDYTKVMLKSYLLTIAGQTAYEFSAPLLKKYSEFSETQADATTPSPKSKAAFDGAHILSRGLSIDTTVNRQLQFKYIFSLLNDRWSLSLSEKKLYQLLTLFYSIGRDLYTIVLSRYTITGTDETRRTFFDRLYAAFNRPYAPIQGRLHTPTALENMDALTTFVFDGFTDGVLFDTDLGDYDTINYTPSTTIFDNIFTIYQHASTITVPATTQLADLQRCITNRVLYPYYVEKLATYNTFFSAWTDNTKKKAIIDAYFYSVNLVLNANPMTSYAHLDNAVIAEEKYLVQLESATNAGPDDVANTTIDSTWFDDINADLTPTVQAVYYQRYVYFNDMYSTSPYDFLRREIQNRGYDAFLKDIDRVNVIPSDYTVNIDSILNVLREEDKVFFMGIYLANYKTVPYGDQSTVLDPITSYVEHLKKAFVFSSYEKPHIFIDVSGIYHDLFSIDEMHREFYQAIKDNNTAVLFKAKLAANNDINDMKDAYNSMTRNLDIRTQTVQTQIQALQIVIDNLKKSRGGDAKEIIERTNALERIRQSHIAQINSISSFLVVMQTINDLLKDVNQRAIAFQKKLTMYHLQMDIMKSNLEDYKQMLEDIKARYPAYVTKLNDYLQTKSSLTESLSTSRAYLSAVETLFTKVFENYNKDLGTTVTTFSGTNYSNPETYLGGQVLNVTNMFSTNTVDKHFLAP